MKNLTATELHDYLQQAEPRPVLLDVREPWEHEKCQIEGSTLLPMSRIAAALNELDPEQETVVICHHGVRSYRVAQWLEQMGFRNIINLYGGINAWAQQVDPSMTRY